MKNITFAQLYPKDSLPSWCYQPFTGFVTDSRQVQQGHLFVALQSSMSHSTDKTKHYITYALNQGAIGVISEVDFPELEHVVYIPHLRQILGTLQQQFLQAQHPQTLARAVAVTGTNGKTTISRLIAELLTLLQQPTAVMGTTGNGILPHLTPSTHTTLQAVDFQTAYYQFSQQGAKFLTLEASSHGLDQGRLAGTPIEVASFSNLSHDHLDYHGTLEHYAQSKAALFLFPSLNHVIIQVDDEYSSLMMDYARRNESQPQIWTYSIQHDQADYWVSELNFSLHGATFTLHTPNGEYFVNSALLGKFNVANLVQAIISVEKLGFNLTEILPLVPQLVGAAGRMQSIVDDQRLFIVDYAHTPDALKQVLTSLRPHVDGKLWVVFGCGGDRDRTKRPIMTKMAMDYADKLIITTDNPRTEPVEQIVADMVNQFDISHVELLQLLDRREAIKYTVQHAQSGDIVIIAGKGHENYQEIDGVRHWFDDCVEVRSALAQQHCGLPPTYSV